MAQNLQDQHYRRLFSSSHRVRALLDGMFPANLRQQLDLDTLRPTQLVSGKHCERLTDSIWQVRFPFVEHNKFVIMV